MAIWKDLPTRYVQQTITPGEGVDTFRSPLQISAGQASDMQDFSSRQYPALKTREGRSALLATMPAVPLSIHCTPAVVDPTGASGSLVTFYHIITGDGWYYTDDLYGSGEWQPVQLDLGTSDPNFSYSFANWFNFTTGYWDVYVLRPDAGGNYTITSFNTSTKAVTTIAYATYPVISGPMCSYLNRMFTQSNDTHGQFAYSKLNDPTVWTSPDGGILPIGSNDKIVSLLPMRDRLFIGTNNGLYACFGDSEENFVISSITNAFGLPSGRHACATESTIYLSDGTDIYRYDTVSGLSNITRGASGGFSEHSISISCIGTDGKRVYASGHGSGYSGVANPPDWYVYDIKYSKWYIERGLFNNSSTASEVFPCMMRSNDARLICSEFGYEISPKLRIVDYAVGYDNFNQHNAFADSRMQTVGNFTALGGADSIVGDVYRTTGNGSSAILGFYADTTVPYLSGMASYINSLVFFKITAKASTGVLKMELIAEGSTGGSTVIDSVANPTADSWMDYYGFFSPIDGLTTGTLRIRVEATFVDAAGANGKIFYGDMIVVDNLMDSFGGFATNYTNYYSDMPLNGSYKWFDVLNPTTTIYNVPSFEYVSPCFQIRPSDKKTLANLWLSADLSGATSFVVQTSSDLSSTSFSTVYTMGTAPSKPSVTKIKVPISKNPKSDWIRVKIYGTGQATLLNYTLDWRPVGRAR